MPDHEIPADSLSKGDRYRLMTSLIIPRPIAWVSTVDGAGHRNLAPFSYFQGVSSDPPTVVIGMGWLASGQPKDSLRNVLETGELTVSFVNEDLASAMNQTSAAYPAHTDEWEQAGVAAAASHTVAPERVRDALAALECKLTHAIPLGEGPAGGPSTTLVIARIVHFHVQEGLIQRTEGNKLAPVDPARLATVGRLGGIAYTKTTDVFELPRPKVS